MISDDESAPMNGEALDLLEDAWDASPIKVRRDSPLPTVRLHLTGSSALRRSVGDALLDERNIAGATWARWARVYAIVMEHDADRGGTLKDFDMESVRKAINKVMNERLPSGVLVRGHLNTKMLTGSSESP